MPTVIPVPPGRRKNVTEGKSQQPAMTVVGITYFGKSYKNITAWARIASPPPTLPAPHPWGLGRSK